MTSYNPKTSTKIPPDIMEKTYILTSSPAASSSSMSVQITSKTARIIAKNDEQFDLYNASQSDLYIASPIQKKQDKKRSIANLAAILSLLDVQICIEEDSEILAILTGQKTTMNEILIQKQSGKKGSFKTAEKEVISQLQNQVSSLEKSVDKKFETILRSIQDSQSTVNSWAQVAAAGNQKKQKQQQEVPAAKEQRQEIPAAKTQKQSQKQAQKQNHESYQARRLFLHVKTEI
jgi:hypothetical protein